MKGKIIVLEGLDGSGKSTQVQLLTDHFTRHGKPFRFIHFPMLNAGIYGTLIAEFLRGEYGNLEEVHAKLVALLFANDRGEHLPKVMEWLSEGNTVLMDRYVNSNIAFQCAKLVDPEQKTKLKQWILDYEFGHLRLPKPDVSMFLDVPLEIIKNSLESNRTGDNRDYLNGKEDIHESSMDFQTKVYDEYKSMLIEQEDFVPINCMNEQNCWKSPLSISQTIIKQLPTELQD